MLKYNQEQINLKINDKHKSFNNYNVIFKTLNYAI